MPSVNSVCRYPVSGTVFYCRFILLMKNSHDAIIDKALTKMVMERIANEWERVGTEQMCRDIKERIRHGIQAGMQGAAE